MSLVAGKNPRVGRAAPGVMVPLVFGFVFILANAGTLPGSWQVIARILGVLIGLAILIVHNRLCGRQAGAGSAGPAQAAEVFSRRYWTIVAVEAVAILAGEVAFNTAGAQALAVPWLVFVVGVHFFGLAPLWNRQVFYLVLGTVVTLLGVAGFVLYAAGASHSAVQGVPGIGAGVALYAAVAVTLLPQFRALPEASSGES